MTPVCQQQYIYILDIYLMLLSWLTPQIKAMTSVILILILSLTLCVFVFVNEQQSRFLTNAMGHELKSVRSKKHLWLSTYMTHHQGEAKCLGRGSRRDFGQYILKCCLSSESTRRTKEHNQPHDQVHPVLCLSACL